MALISYHRGGGETHKSGTLAAYQAAADQKAELIEADVWRSSDGVLFCAHDEFDHDGTRLSDLPWPEVKKRLPDTPTFAEILQLCDGVSICHVDLKGTGYELDSVALVLELLTDPVASAWFTTLDDDSVALIRRQHPELMAVLSLGRDTKDEPLWVKLRTRASEFFPFARMRKTACTGIAVNHRLLSWPLKQYCHRTDRKIMVWTLNADDRLRKFLSDDLVDVVITDRPLAATAIRAGLD